jgi:hypothetical protein
MPTGKAGVAMTQFRLALPTEERYKTDRQQAQHHDAGLLINRRRLYCRDSAK